MKRVIDFSIIQDIIADLSCPYCLERGTLCVQEDNDKKKGLSSHLTISCECGDDKETYTSKVVN